MSWGDDQTIFAVVINHEAQHSIWPSYKKIPMGWRAVGQQGNKEVCLAYIEEHWTDMRPLSLRRAMEQEAPAARHPSRPEP
ncbi:MAG: MbtH family protein [Candidatus Tectimicrobiota bacterium]